MTSSYRFTANLSSKNKVFCGAEAGFGLCLGALLNLDQRGPGCSRIALSDSNGKSPGQTDQGMKARQLQERHLVTDAECFQLTSTECRCLH